MPTRSEFDLRPLAYRILLLQTGVGLAVALGSLGIWGRDAFISALAGAGTGVVANLYMTFKALQPARSAPGALGRLVMGQAVKVLITVAVFVLATRWPRVSWPALLLAYVSTLVVFWWVPFASAPQSKM